MTFPLVWMKFGTTKTIKKSPRIAKIPISPNEFASEPMTMPRTPKSKSPKVVF